MVKRVRAVKVLGHGGCEEDAEDDDDEDDDDDDEDDDDLLANPVARAWPEDGNRMGSGFIEEGVVKRFLFLGRLDAWAEVGSKWIPPEDKVDSNADNTS